MILMSRRIKPEITNDVKLKQELWKGFKENFIDLVLFDIPVPEILDCLDWKNEDTAGEGE